MKYFSIKHAELNTKRYVRIQIFFFRYLIDRQRYIKGLSEKNFLENSSITTVVQKYMISDFMQQPYKRILKSSLHLYL